MLALGIVVFAGSMATLAWLHVGVSGQHWSMLDMRIYRWAGMLARRSGDLYGVRFPGYHLRFTYSPFAALIFALISFVPLTLLEWLSVVAGVLCLTATVWLAFGALGYARTAERIGGTLAVAGVAVWLGPDQQTLGLGQVNLLLMLLIVADLRLPDKAWIKGVGIGLAAGFKLTPLIFIPYLLLTRRFRAAAVAMATFAATIVVSLVVLPGQSRLFWFDGLLLKPGRTGNVAYVGNQSLNGAITRLLGSTSAASPYWLAASLAVAAAGLLIATWWARRGREMIGILVCALTGLLISPISWAHHWVWAAPALVVAIDLIAGRGSRIRPADSDRRELASARRRRWGYGLVAVVLAVPFFAVPETLVPASVIQGHGAHGLQLLTSNVYVIIGLILLGLAAGPFLTRNRPASLGSGWWPGA
jgi:alpha-1,2-mannosyltransferase